MEIIQLPIKLFKNDYIQLSDSAKWLYCALIYLKSNSNQEEYWISCTDQQLARILNCSISKLRRSKTELKEIGLIETTVACKIGQSDRKTCYKIL